MFLNKLWAVHSCKFKWRSFVQDSEDSDDVVDDDDDSDEDDEETSKKVHTTTYPCFSFKRSMSIVKVVTFSY